MVGSPNYGRSSFKEKLIRNLKSRFSQFINNTSLQYKAYPAYWHYKCNKRKSDIKESVFYLTQKPNYGAGIGHQLANWNSGLYYSQVFGCKFAHSSFSSPKWEQLLGYNENEVNAYELIQNKTFKKVSLPRFDKNHIPLIQKIINSYKGKKILFILDTDQGYGNQYETYEILSEKFFKASARKEDKLIFEDKAFNIAIHIRRRMKIETDEVWENRGLNNSYFVSVLEKVLSVLQTTKKINIYLFSQGEKGDFKEFEKFSNLHYCMDMNPYDSFLHMVFADVLISSKSSFSYKPALISKGIKICPKTFWHLYPSTPDFIQADNQGNFDIEHFSRILQNKE